MTKRLITLSLNIPDSLSNVICHNLDVLKDNEKLSVYLGETVLEKLQDEQAIRELNEKIKFNMHERMQTVDVYYETVLNRLKALEQQIDNLRYDMHTAAVLANKTLYKEISISIMANIDVLFKELSLSIKPNSSDYLDQRKWLDKERAIQQRFQESLSAFKLIQAAFEEDFEDNKQRDNASDSEMYAGSIQNDAESNIADTSQNLDNVKTESSKVSESVDQNSLMLLEKMDTLLAEIADVKYALRNSTVMEAATIRRNLEFSGTEIPEEPRKQEVYQTPVIQETSVIKSEPGIVPKVTTEIPDVADIDISALVDFFG